MLNVERLLQMLSVLNEKKILKKKIAFEGKTHREVFVCFVEKKSLTKNFKMISGVGGGGGGGSKL